MEHLPGERKQQSHSGNGFCVKRGGADLIEELTTAAKAAVGDKTTEKMIDKQ
ncbi:hypothetical protein [Salisediminibacterium beveridgei]|uniref:hypothetical protein n=1 Tax=Salisediminibacterium beveridgei TaxID=632773 RepID=UPI0012EE652B|nr:hypothetical protein [Salisediminibacterium beveridgei]